jgi:hypothetical protein
MFRAAASSAAAGFIGSTPQPRAVPGMICAMPAAPAGERAMG